ncbi:magnesium transporter [Litoreibacter arenae]|uniref:Magnesium transporter MgtE n=1 Tax=Litoreibacter arenae DSM 19593 TaxID=1123360 RepID=S9QFH6_9RHOB|nr:magnesium transporter [Litoreibacter arenae]EPX80181.1 Mg/Co/Ni transporter MgtE / CBS domain protein [Litoreibacter arenae DSM 19593]
MPLSSPHAPRIYPETDASAQEIAAFVEFAHVVDVAGWLEQLSRPDASQRLLALQRAQRAKVFGNMSLDAQVDLARLMTMPDLAGIVTQMDADDRVDLFNRLTPEEQQQLMGQLAREDRDDIRQLSAHDEGSAGALMTSDYAVLGSDMTAVEAISELKRQAPETETIYRSYILDEQRRLIGSIQLHRLVLAADTALIGDLMEANPVSVPLEADREEVAHLIARYDLFALPVVDAQGVLLGIVTHDDASDALQAEMTEDFQKISTVLPFSQSMRDASIRVLYSRRIVWLALLVFGNLFSGAGIAYFEETILAYVSLVFFLPLLIDSSGNAGAQSATLMVRALATGDVAMRDWRDLIGRELLIAAALGATMALVVFPIGIWRGGADVALVVGLTMVLVVIIGSLVGMSLPFLLSRLKLDPATASGPLVTTISDAVGVMIYFSIATMVLSL